MFSRLFRKDPLKPVAARLYDETVAAARRPFLYGPDGAPDTVDGRFDMIVLHAVLLMRRLRQGGEGGQALSQLVFDTMFSDMDGALREMGTGDLSVGKKIKAMGEAFYGRAKAYDEALAAEDDEALSAAIARNLSEDLSGEGANERSIAVGRRLAAYARAADAALDAQPAEGFLEGQSPHFPAAG
jgi:cytochrome b pre-mRNA-processing protein 3